MRPKLVLLLLLGVLLAAGAGCGGGEETTPTPDDVQGSVPADTGGGDTGATDTGATDTEGTDTGATDTGAHGEEDDPGDGKNVFASAGCGSCHTLADAGSTGTVGPNLDEAMPDRDLVEERVTNGAGAMPAFKDQLSMQQINDVAVYVSSVAGS